MGEPAKWVPIATRRILAVVVSQTAGLTVELSGDAGEEVALAFAEVATTAGGVAQAAAAAAAAAAAGGVAQVAAASSSVLSVQCTLSSAGRATAMMGPSTGSAPTCK